MTNSAIVVFDEFCTWLDESPFAEFRQCLGFVSVDIQDYEDCFWAAGFTLPPSLRDFVKERGLLWTRGITDDAIETPRYNSTGIEMLGVDRLTKYGRYLNDFVGEDVANAEHWFLFATQHDLEPAYAFDKRFCNADEYEIGLFHQDEVI